MMSSGVAWIVSDDEPLAHQLSNVLQRECKCESVRQTATYCSDADAHIPRCIFIDLRNGHGWEQVKAIHDCREDRSSKPVAMIGILGQGYPLDQCMTASHLLDGWISESWCVDELRGLINRLNPTNGARRCPKPALQSKVLESKRLRFETHTPSLCELLENLEMTASHNFTILLVGETGTGKTTLARILHELSDRRGKPFVNVGCGALPPDLIDSELFGHVKGSFTGADSTTDGKFAAAKDGSILLDEIDTLGLAQQVKLLRVLESGEFEQLGANNVRQVNARIFVATNIDLELLIQRKEFRQDLYFRLNQVKFEISTLR